MKFPTLFFALSLLLFSGSSATAQTVVEVTQQNRVTAFSLTLLGIPAEFDVNNYVILYTSTDPFGNLDTLSGLITVPEQTDFALPLTVYNHGTVRDRELVPSRLPPPFSFFSERTIIHAIGSNGYITLSPDYFGLGDNPGLHPYVHRDSEARAGRDLLTAARVWLDEEDIAYNEQIFTTGYSQGGHASMALQRDLQLNPEAGTEVTAAAHLSGPYSISEVMVNTLFDPNLETESGFVVYAYISFNYVNQLFSDNGQIFVAEYVDLVDDFESEILNLGDFSLMLDARLAANGDQITDVFQDSILQQLMEQDTATSRIYRAIVENDTYRFAPDAPTLLVYCTEDEQVPFQNALLADSVMRTEFGATTVTLLNGGPEDHGGCVIPAVTGALSFFGPIARRDLISSLGGPVDLPGLALAPNPVQRGGAVNVTGLDIQQTYPWFLYEATGRLVGSGKLSGNGTVRLPERTSGLTTLRIALPDGNFVVRRLIVR